MNSLSKKDCARSSPEFYAPPWVRELTRAVPGPVSPPVEKWPRDDVVTQASQHSVHDRPCYHRALEPEWVPTPPTGALNLRPIMLRMGIACTVTAISVAAAMVLLHHPTQNAQKGERATNSPVWVTALASPLNEAPPRPAIVQPAVNVKEPAAQPVKSSSAGRDTSAKAQIAAIPEQQSEGLPARQQPLPKPTVTLDDNEVQMLIKRGNNLLKDGDFAAARLLFERAANAGSAAAALALGSTYDPSVIKQLGALSVASDRDRALKWYETAADHGSGDAADRSANLMRAR
jgi:hypothetical protein